MVARAWPMQRRTPAPYGAAAVRTRAFERASLALSCVLVLAPAIAGSRALRIDIARVQTDAVTLEKVHATLTWPADADRGELVLQAASLRALDGRVSLDAPRWRCTLQRTETGAHCAGDARAREGRGKLRIAVVPDAVDAALDQGDTRLALQWPLDDAAPRPPSIEAKSLPLDWLQPLLAEAWPEARFTGGTLSGTLALHGEGEATRLDGAIAADALGLDTSDGRIAAAELSLHGPIDVTLGSPLQLDTTLQLTGGELLAGPVYASLPDSGVELTLGVREQADGWRIDPLRWRDSEALHLQGSLQLASSGPLLSELDIDARIPDLALASGRYLATVFDTIGVPGLALQGAATISAHMAGGSVTRMVAELDAVSAIDAHGRFALDGGTGRIGWQATATALDGRFGWSAASLYGLPLGATGFAWHSADRRLALTEPARIPLAGGALLLERLAWRPGIGEEPPQLAMTMAVEGAELAALSRQFDWPEFGGTVSGRIPSAQYENGVLTLEGGLSLQVFDGTVQIGTLALERPFGVAPTLGADIALRNLDLVPLTGAFGFGSISGRLDGRIAGLRLVDWEPVAFDAELRTSKSADDKRRISQRAVSDLTSVGGGGIAGGIQASMLRMFETFGYEQIGLSCRLENNICHMGGLAPVQGEGGGYVIVDGSGLPRINVIGHQRRVDWPVLLSRLKAATEGQAPVVE